MGDSGSPFQFNSYYLPYKILIAIIPYDASVGAEASRQNEESVKISNPEIKICYSLLSCAIIVI